MATKFDELKRQYNLSRANTEPTLDARDSGVPSHIASTQSTEKSPIDLTLTVVQAVTLNKMLPKGIKVFDAYAPKDAQDYSFDSENEGFIYIGKDMPTSRQAQIMENKHREEKLSRKEAYRKMTAVDPGRKKAFNQNSVKNMVKAGPTEKK